MLNFELLRAFVAVAECVGFHRAVEQLNLTQLTVRPEIGANTICRCWLESALLLAQEVKLLSCFSQLVVTRDGRARSV
jgi:hypothetical protein